MDDLVERARTYGKLSQRPLPSWARTTLTACANRIDAQESEIRSLRAQVEQERAGIVAWLRGTPHANWQAIAAAIERHEDKEPRA